MKFHDIHHWFPESNYGQYIMLWDHVFASYKPYPLSKKEEALDHHHHHDEEEEEENEDGIIGKTRRRRRKEVGVAAR